MSMMFVPLSEFVCRYRQLPTSHTSNLHKNLCSYISIIDMTTFGFGGKVDGALFEKQRLGPDERALYINGRVFYTLGLAVAYGLQSVEVGRILAELYPKYLSVRLCSDEFLEGLHFGLHKRKRKQIPECVQVDNILACLDKYLWEKGLLDYRAAIFKSITLSFEQPFRKRSLIARISDRLGRSFHRSFGELMIPLPQPMPVMLWENLKSRLFRRN